MRVPSDAQAALLALVAEREAEGLTVEWQTNPDPKQAGYRSRARLYVEVIDREQNTVRFDMADGYRFLHRTVTVEACIRAGWLSVLHERTKSWPATRWTEAHEWRLVQLDLIEDGVIALGLWRERKLRSPPAALPEVSDREREVLELAQRALELGYALCAREPARGEVRKMRRAGLATGCWVANHARGIVPTPLALVEIRPDQADRPLELSP